MPAVCFKAAAYGLQDVLDVLVHLVTLLLDIGRDAAAAPARPPVVAHK